MKTALIGYTGFVGSNLAAQYHFDDLYNTSNIKDIEGKSYDLVVSAGARAEKWRINQEPERDRAEIDDLISHLQTVTAGQFVLISTVDVYMTPIDVDEDSSIDLAGLHPYGMNRYHLEQFVRKNFDGLILRLPGLFGDGLKKNVIFDLLNDNNIDRIHHAGSFQYYNLNYLWKDIQLGIANNIKLLNLATEPVRTDEIARYCFDTDFKNEPEGVAAGLYDFRSKHASLFGGSNGYLYSKQQELDDIKAFVKKERTKR